MKRRIILDTNFLLIPGQFNVDIFSEIARICNFGYELVVVKETVAELQGIIASKVSNGLARASAKLALQLMGRFKVKVVGDYRKVFKRADEAILAVADRNCLVATQDMQLKRALKGSGCGLIVLRQKQYLQLFGG